MSHQDDLKRLILMANRRLQTLEQQQARSGADIPPHLLMEIDDLNTELANLQAELEELAQTRLIQPPENIQGLYYTTKAALAEFRQTLDHLSRELAYIPAAAQARAGEVIEQAKQRFLELEKEWIALDIDTEAAETALKALQSNLSVASSRLAPLILRYTHRRRFSLLEEKLAGQQLTLTEEQLQTTLQPQIAKLQEQIQVLEDRAALSVHEQKLMTTYRRNLELCQQMLARERRYAPLSLLSEWIELEQTLKDIDLQLAGS